jgi:hypothetical protein
MQGTHSAGRIAKLDFRVTAPRQKGGVILAAINELEHAFGRLLDQDGLFNKCHAAATFLNPVESQF